MENRKLKKEKQNKIWTDICNYKVASLLKKECSETSQKNKMFPCK